LIQLSSDITRYFPTRFNEGYAKSVYSSIQVVSRSDLGLYGWQDLPPSATHQAPSIHRIALRAMNVIFMLAATAMGLSIHYAYSCLS
jgi:hypothetical protein